MCFALFFSLKEMMGFLLTFFFEKGVERRLSVRNTLLKMLLDQTLAAAVNNAGFLMGITLVRGGSWASAIGVLSEVG